MRKLCVVLMAAFGWIAFVSQAQDTNALKTNIGVFEARTGAVIIKGFGQTGSMSVGADVISVRCKESTDAGTGHKIYGLVIEIAASNQPKERALVDDGEIDSLLNGINYLGKITYDVTALPAFEAVYTTKAGLQIIAYSSRRQGGIQTFLQYGNGPRILLMSDQMAQLQGLIGQARNTLDSLKATK
jgi:hypothetical protein